MFAVHPLLRPPAELPPASAKLYVMRCTLPLLAGVMHLVQAVIFWLIGLRGLALLSVGSLLVFAVALSLIRAGRARLGVWVAFVEAALHVPLLAVLLGPGAGYLTYAFPLATAPFLAMAPDQRAERAIAVGYTAVLALALSWYGRHHGPILDVGSALDIVFYMNMVGVVFAVVASSAWFDRTASLAEARVEEERARAEGLLRNVLPEAIAERLKREPGTIAERYDEVAVLFADLVGFTSLSSTVSPERVVDMLDELFVAFDDLADRHGLEKIKTIGDAYLVVAGLPSPHDDPIGAVAAMALDMRVAVRDWSERTGRPLSVRIGLHAGPVVAGVIGRRKFAYDLWGDTVNTASRMESHGEPDRIQLSEAVAERLEGRFPLEARGTVEVKGKGPMRTWWLEAPVAGRVAVVAGAEG